MTSEDLQSQPSIKLKHLKLERKCTAPCGRSEIVTLRRPHLHVVDANATTQTVHQKSDEGHIVFG